VIGVISAYRAPLLFGDSFYLVQPSFKEVGYVIPVLSSSQGLRVKSGDTKAASVLTTYHGSVFVQPLLDWKTSITCVFLDLGI